jgi:hypothetical protein
MRGKNHGSVLLLYCAATTTAATKLRVAHPPTTNTQTWRCHCLPDHTQDDGNEAEGHAGGSPQRGHEVAGRRGDRERRTLDRQGGHESTQQEREAGAEHREENGKGAHGGARLRGVADRAAPTPMYCTCRSTALTHLLGRNVSCPKMRAKAVEIGHFWAKPSDPILAVSPQFHRVIHT